MTTITANVTKMFSSYEPWDCSNSAANLGDNAGKLTWEAAMAVADCCALYEQTDWEQEPMSPIGSYYVAGPRAPFSDVHVAYYAGC